MKGGENVEELEKLETKTLDEYTREHIKNPETMQEAKALYEALKKDFELVQGEKDDKLLVFTGVVIEYARRNRPEVMDAKTGKHKPAAGKNNMGLVVKKGKVFVEPIPAKPKKK